MRNFLPILLLGCSRGIPVEKAQLCAREIQVVEEKCRKFGPRENIDEELADVRYCTGMDIEAVCIQNTILESRHLNWIVK